jgi:hypothetical protein
MNIRSQVLHAEPPLTKVYLVVRRLIMIEFLIKCSRLVRSVNSGKDNTSTISMRKRIMSGNNGMCLMTF